MDETGFCIGYKIAYCVITMDSEKQLLLSDKNNIKFLTACKSINIEGIEIPPMIILSDAITLEKWVQENNFNRDILLATKLTNYSIDKLAFK